MNHLVVDKRFNTYWPLPIGRDTPVPRGGSDRSKPGRRSARAGCLGVDYPCRANTPTVTNVSNRTTNASASRSPVASWCMSRAGSVGSSSASRASRIGTASGRPSPRAVTRSARFITSPSSTSNAEPANAPFSVKHRVVGT